MQIRMRHVVMHCWIDDGLVLFNMGLQPRGVEAPPSSSKLASQARFKDDSYCCAISHLIFGEPGKFIQVRSNANK